MRLIVGISGATGPQYGIRMLEVLHELGIESHLIISERACYNVKLESDDSVEYAKSLATAVYDVRDVGAAPASGSFLSSGMVVVPCSIKTLSAIANCYNDNLLVRTADVTLKEKRRLVLMVRETPLHIGHLKLMTAACEAGATILPPMPAFYHHPKTIEELVDQTIGKVLDQFGIAHNLFERWGGPPKDEQGEQDAGCVKLVR